MDKAPFCSPEQFAALLNRIEMHAEADVLTAPRCQSVGSGLRVQMSAGQSMTCVTGVETTNGSAGNGASVNYSTENVTFGITVEVRPKLEENGQWRLRVRASDTAFIGYDDPGRNKAFSPVPGGKPIEYAIPLPHFRALEAEAEDSLLLGQTLVLRGPPMDGKPTRPRDIFSLPAKPRPSASAIYNAL